MNLTDLREVLHEHAAGAGPDERAHTLLSDVHRRFAARRRRRAVAGVAAVVLGLAGAGAVAVVEPFDRPDTAPVAPAVRTIDGFREYSDGARVIATAVSAPDQREVTVRVGLPRHGFGLWTRCPGTGDTEIWVDGKRAYSTDKGCPGGLIRDSDLDLGDLTVGATLTVTLKASSGPVALAVGESLSVSSYQFPPRPARLRPLDADRPADPDGAGENALAVRADPADPNRPVTVVGIWREQYRISLVAQTPGRLTLTVANRLAAQETWWDFDQGVRTTTNDGRFLEDGEPFAVTVTPEGMSGDWLVRLER